MWYFSTLNDIFSFVSPRWTQFRIHIKLISEIRIRIETLWIHINMVGTGTKLVTQVGTGTYVD